MYVVVPSEPMNAFMETNLGTEKRVLVDITDISAIQENQPTEGATTIILRSGAAFEISETYDALIARMRQAIEHARAPRT